jgi:hypothetical protein
VEHDRQYYAQGEVLGADEKHAQQDQRLDHRVLEETLLGFRELKRYLARSHVKHENAEHRE